MKYVYETATGEIEIEVDPHYHSILSAMDREEFNSERKHNRRKAVSLDSAVYGGRWLSDEADLLDDLIQQETIDRLRMAIRKLPMYQRVLIEHIFLKKEKIVDVARRYGVPESTLRGRLNQICCRLKKILNKSRDLAFFEAI
jgi:DNA-directed RNA polymerase specialized sigma24 family protein